MPAGRNVASIEALKPRDGMRAAIGREIRRQSKYLSAVSGTAGVIRHAAGLGNPTPREALTPHRRFSPARTLTQCAGVAANRRPIRGRNFSCGKTRFFRGDDVAVPFSIVPSLYKEKNPCLDAPAKIDHDIPFFATSKCVRINFTSSARHGQFVDRCRCMKLNNTSTGTVLRIRPAAERA
jgi:hypothetical protein